ncbi:hypothetical protein C0991_004357, partial [Blastosporella zonata]
MHDDLQAEYTAKNTSAKGGQVGTLDNIVGLDDWCTAVGHIDEGLRAKKERETKLYLRQLQAMGNMSSTHSSIQGTPVTPSGRSNTNDTSSLSIPKPARSYALPLTIKECNLLAANKGCTACRKVFLPSDHKCKYRNKPLPFGAVPTITQAHVDKIRSDIFARRDKKQTTNQFPSAIAYTTNVGAVLNTLNDKDDNTGTFEILDADINMHPD